MARLTPLWSDPDGILVVDGHAGGPLQPPFVTSWKSPTRYPRSGRERGPGVVLAARGPGGLRKKVRTVLRPASRQPRRPGAEDGRLIERDSLPQVVDGRTVAASDFRECPAQHTSRGIDEQPSRSKAGGMPRRRDSGGDRDRKIVSFNRSSGDVRSLPRSSPRATTTVRWRSCWISAHPVALRQEVKELTPFQDQTPTAGVKDERVSSGTRIRRRSEARPWPRVELPRRPGAAPHGRTAAPQARPSITSANASC